MKKILSVMAFIAIFALTLSCQKEAVTPAIRKVQFVLYTNEDFSSSDGNITFSIVIKSGSKILLDSGLATMKLKEIPNQTNQIVIEKRVPGNDQSKLLVGFRYALENVGNSWYYDSCSAGQTFKKVEYAFR
ncbi:MAG TPA: hypothetical protein VL728_17880 [Cyclobacteriaceae bacterium]|jgi:hypothetical protein|nr:hypothetical protein [Cyclobacteriaceae bacterium]